MTSLRLIDLHCDWLLQYACETTTFDPALYAGIEGRIDQSAGYLQGASAAVLACYRRAEDWARQADPWHALWELITRIEAEFPGRLLIGSDDFARWQDDPESLCWGVLGIEGFDRLIRNAADLDRLPRLHTRGVRVFQPVYTPDNVLAGSAAGAEDRGLTDLGRAFLETLCGLPGGPRAALDLAHMSPAAISDVLQWFEADPPRRKRLIPLYSHGALRHAQFHSPRAITPESLGRLRALGGLIGFSVGPPFYGTPEALKAGMESAATMPFLGRPGFEGIAIGTDFLGVDQTLPGLGSVEEILGWLRGTFDASTAEAIAWTNALPFMKRISGA